jgi:hypothetical protein
LLRRPSNFLRKFSSLVRSFNFAMRKKFLAVDYCCDERVVNSWGDVSFRRGCCSVVVLEIGLVFAEFHNGTMGTMNA